MNQYQNHPLKSFNTFGIDARAKHLIELEKESEILPLLESMDRPIYILGEGSNILLSKNLEDLVLKNNLKGKYLDESNGDEVMVAVAGGENWHEFVSWCVENGLGGVENLALIPGTVGAAPVQNIGAYGVELEDVFVKLEGYDIFEKKKKTFWKTDCAFSYRDSLFKRELKDRFLITKVWLKLTRQNHRINASYAALSSFLEKNNIESPGIREIMDAVIHIRNSKLPDPSKLGNAGSFFKNPEVGEEKFGRLLKKFPNLVYYPLGDKGVKIPAAWLIDQCGWKGYRSGDAACYKKQPLVLVNYGNAKGKEILRLANSIIKSVNDRFGIKLQPEVNIW